LPTVWRLVFVALCIASCGKKHQDEVPSGSGTGSAPAGSGSVAAVLDAIAGDNPTLAVVRRAFDGKAPELPLLARDGQTAAVELDTQLDLSGASTYAVAFVSASGPPEVVTVVDAKLAHVLVEAPGEDGKPPVIDTATLATTAATITTRLADFTSFEGRLEELSSGDPIAVGPGKLQIGELDAPTLAIKVLDGAGKPVAEQTLKPRPMGKVADLDCVSQPIPRHAWFDTPRKRILLQIGWNAGPDQCNAPDAEFYLFAIP
jgi:hypothetical protein